MSRARVTNFVAAVVFAVASTGYVHVGHAASSKVTAAQKEKAAILSVAAHDALSKGDYKMAAKL